MSDSQQQPQQPAERPRFVNAAEAMRFVARDAERLRESADAYLAAFDQTPRPHVEVGAFYATFDGSLVFVLRLANRCQCPACSGRGGGAGGASPIMDFIASITGLQPVQLQPVSAEPAGVPEPQHVEEAAETPREFVVALLRGGHGLKGIRGEAPGETYVVDAQGLAVVGNRDEDAQQRRELSQAHCALAGLSLSRRLVAKFE